MLFITKFIFSIILTELFTELIVKSVIFKPVRDRIKSINTWFKELMGCGYCISIWVAFGVVLLVQPVYPLTGTTWIDLPLTAFSVHRLSNILHNCIDKLTDKYYDTRFINSEHNESSEIS